MNALFEQLVLDPIRRSIVECAGNNAFFISGQYYSYAEFGEAVGRIRKSFSKAEGRVFSIEIDDTMETYATIVALWMENKAFVPLNPRQPKERNQIILNQLKEFDVNDYKDDLAYVLFTSGSTGTPKGVAISQKNLAAFIDSFWKTGIHLSENDRCLQCFDLTFDVSIQSFLVALTSGACVYTVPYGQVKFPYVASLIHEHHVTFGAMAPSMLNYLRPYFSELDASAFKVCILTAEACPVDLIEDWRKCARNVEVYDFYGPTEATVYCTYFKCPKGVQILSHNGIVSIGKPLSNVTAVLLDESGEVVRDGEQGELCLSGDQVTQGYWNNEEKNRTSFFEMEEGGIPRRYYRTGDLCFYGNDGNLLYLGRIDHQVKIQGFRVELGEIEYHARLFFEQQNRVVSTAFRNEQGITEIALFVEKEKEASDALLVFLRSKMPNYMIPSRVVYLPVFPLNSNDKIDREKLKSLL